MLRPTMNLAKMVAIVDRAYDDEFLDGFLAVETWGNDNVGFPGECWRTWVEELYRGDALARGTFALSGRPARLEGVTCPLLVVTFEHDAPARALLVRVGHDRSREQRLRVGMLRVAEELVARRELDELPEVHHRDAVAQELDRREVVRDEEAREAHLALQVAKQVEDRRLHRHVERRNGLVRDQDARLEDQRTREPDALALPARQFVRIPVAELGAEADQVEDLLDARPQVAALRDPVQPQRLADDRTARHARVQRRVRILEDHVQLASQRPHLPSREMRDVDAAQQDLAGGRLGEPHDAVGDGRFAAAGLADQPEQLPATELERDIVHSVHERALACDPAADAVVLDEVANLERGIGAGHSGPGWKHATRWPGRICRSSGTWERESSSARGQRSANAHIVGSSRSDGTRPGISRSRGRSPSPS